MRQQRRISRIICVCLRQSANVLSVKRKQRQKLREMTIEDGAVVAEIEHQSFSDAWSEKAILETLGTEQ